MVLFAIEGELGAGKTISLTYLAWYNWFTKGRKIYANYDLYGIPFIKINSVPSIDKMSDGFVAFDEMWLWVDSYASKDKKTKLISDILLKSRKRFLTLCFTTQDMMQVARRVRKICDFSAYPNLNPDGSYCKIRTFKGFDSMPIHKKRPVSTPIYFPTEYFYAMYDTTEEVKPVEEDPNKIIFKEVFNPIHENPAWLLYLEREKNITSKIKIMKETNRIIKEINPKNIRSEKEREGTVKKTFSPI